MADIERWENEGGAMRRFKLIAKDKLTDAQRAAYGRGWDAGYKAGLADGRLSKLSSQSVQTGFVGPIRVRVYDQEKAKAKEKGQGQTDA